jgi:hypothetical protein
MTRSHETTCEHCRANVTSHRSSLCSACRAVKCKRCGLSFIWKSVESKLCTQCAHKRRIADRNGDCV